MPDDAMALRIRPYRPADREQIAAVCLRTAAAGRDATGVYSDDTLMPDVYALPYLAFAPDLAFVLVEDGPSPHDSRVLGYVLGVADTAEFIDWYRREWAPRFAAKHPSPGAPTASRPAYTEAQLVADGRNPERMRIPELDTYPAHLHIDLLPEAQGQGWGRKLIGTLRAVLAARGVPAVHLELDPANTAAHAFYTRLGFHELPSSRADAPLLGIPTSDPVLNADE